MFEKKERIDVNKIVDDIKFEFQSEIPEYPEVGLPQIKMSIKQSLFYFFNEIRRVNSTLSSRISELGKKIEGIEQKLVNKTELSKEISEFRSKMNEINVKTETSVQELNDKISSIQIPDITELINQVNTIIAKQTELEKKIDLTPFGNRLDEIEKETNDLKISFNALVGVLDEELRQKLASSKGEIYKKTFDQHKKMKKIEKQKLKGQMEWKTVELNK